jgi:hypothetical protein
MKMLRYLLTSAALLAAFTAPALANDREMPKHLAGQWSQTSGTNNQGDYTKAKVACKATRLVVFTIHPVGFWIKLADVKPQIMCVPHEVEGFKLGWHVVADCGADDLSTPVYRMGFTFATTDDDNKVSLTRFIPHD